MPDMAASHDLDLEAKVAHLLSQPSVDLDAPCTFECAGCGWRCCTDRDDVILTPYGVLRIAWWLEDVAADYPEWSERIARLPAAGFAIPQGSSSHMPLARVDFKPVGGHTVCPFLVPASAMPDGTPALVRALVEFPDPAAAAHAPLSLCGIHPVRPNVCRLFPLGRIGTPAPGDDRVTDWTYFLQHVSCGRHGPRGDGMTWAQWVDPAEQARNAAGFDVYVEMCTTVFECLSRAGVEPAEAWLDHPPHQLFLNFVFYLLPTLVVPPREKRTHETALAVCLAGKGLLPGVVDSLLRGDPVNADDLAARLFDTVRGAGGG
jgi:Fe-S-cluster containining protein